MIGSVDYWSPLPPDKFETEHYDYHDRYPEGLDFSPSSELHQRVLTQIMERLLYSRSVISQRYDSWEQTDKNLMAYIHLSEKERLEKKADSRIPIAIVVPISFATLETIQTFLISVFLNTPYFRYDPQSEEDVIGVRLMERVIDLHCRRSNIGLRLMNLWRDGLAYNMGAAMVGWKVKTGVKRVSTDVFQMPDPAMAALGAPPQRVNTYAEVEDVIYEGNELVNINPYYLFPDTNASFDKVSEGRFVGFLNRTSYEDLLDEEYTDPTMFNARYLKHIDGSSVFGWNVPSVADNVKTERVNFRRHQNRDIVNMYVKLIPSEWGLGSSDYPEKWLFTVAGDQVILRASRVNLYHNMLPVVACVPNFDGYSVASASILEIMQGLQDTASFMFNSHFANVRKAINDIILVDPQIINYDDMLHPSEGMLVRIRRKFWGQNRLNDGMKQFQVHDVTSRHMGDIANVLGLTERVTGATENLQGIRRSNSARVTAQESRNIQMNALGRMEKISKTISLMTHNPIALMMASNAQQFMSKGEWVKVTGRGEEDLKQIFPTDRIYVEPGDLNVEYDVVEHDASIPGTGDANGMLQAYQSILQSPIAPSFDLVKMALYIFKMMGAKNVSDFVNRNPQAQPQVNPQVMPNEQVQNQVQKGNIVPLGG